MKKLYSLFCILMAAAMLLTACGGKPAEPETLRVWIQWGDNPQQIQTLFDKYTAETGIKVEVTAPLEEDKILPALTGSEPPDVLVLSGGDLVKSYAKEGLVAELTDIIKTGGIDLTRFLRSAAQSMQVWRKDPVPALGHGHVRPVLEQGYVRSRRAGS